MVDFADSRGQDRENLICENILLNSMIDMKNE